MKRLLITGFEPFGGEKINPSWEAVSRLPDKIGEYSLTKLLLPVTFGEAADMTIRMAQQIEADVVLSIGQARERRHITPELVGINLRYASIPDNYGNQPKDESIIKDGNVAEFSTVPARKIADAIQSAGIPAKLSYSAGAYVCNDVLYTLLSHFGGGEVRVGFIHVPYSLEQNKELGMDMCDIERGLIIAIKNLD